MLKHRWGAGIIAPILDMCVCLCGLCMYDIVVSEVDRVLRKTQLVIREGSLSRVSSRGGKAREMVWSETVWLSWRWRPGGHVYLGGGLETRVMACNRVQVTTVCFPWHESGVLLPLVVV